MDVRLASLVLLRQPSVHTSEGDKLRTAWTSYEAMIPQLYQRYANELGGELEVSQF